jgi:hypothetical protein
MTAPAAAMAISLVPENAACAAYERASGIWHVRRVLKPMAYISFLLVPPSPNCRVVRVLHDIHPIHPYPVVSVAAALLS